MDPHGRNRRGVPRPTPKHPRDLLSKTFEILSDAGGCSRCLLCVGARAPSPPSSFHGFTAVLSENEDDMHEDGQKVHLVTHACFARGDPTSGLRWVPTAVAQKS